MEEVKSVDPSHLLMASTFVYHKLSHEVIRTQRTLRLSFMSSQITQPDGISTQK